VRTAWSATRPAHSFFKFRAYPLNVLPSGFGYASDLLAGQPTPDDLIDVHPLTSRYAIPAPPRGSGWHTFSFNRNRGWVNDGENVGESS